MNGSAFGNVKHAAVWQDDLALSIARWYADEVGRLSDRMLGPVEKRRKGHTEVSLIPAAELDARRQAVEEWKRLTNDLITNGYLEHDACYECGGELVPVTETERRDWVYDETETEWRNRTETGDQP